MTLENSVIEGATLQLGCRVSAEGDFLLTQSS